MDWIINPNQKGCCAFAISDYYALVNLLEPDTLNSFLISSMTINEAFQIPRLSVGSRNIAVQPYLIIPMSPKAVNHHVSPSATQKSPMVHRRLASDENQTAH